MTNSIYAVPAGLNADAYKAGHIYQYPKGTSFLMMNLTPRSDKWFNSPLTVDGVVAFGIQRFVKDYLVDHWNKTFFEVEKDEAVSQIVDVMNGVLGEGAIGRKHWEDLHDLGYLPVEVYAVDEGTIVPMKVPMVVFMNTVTGFHWVAGYLEDAFSAEIWKASTIATIALHYKRICKKWAELSCDNLGHLPWQCHDFAMRGMSGFTDDAFNAVGHLTCFQGTDSFPAVYTAKRAYGNNMPISQIGNSVPATEHSVMCANIAFRGKGKEDEYEQRYYGEKETFRKFLTETYPTGIVSVVSDTYNFWRTIDDILPSLRKEIMERDGKLVVRPDSGDPVYVVTGYKAIHLECAKKAYYEHFVNLNINSPKTKAILDMTLEDIDYGMSGWLLSEGYEMVVDREDLESADTVILKDVYRSGVVNVVVRPKAEIDGALRTLYNVFGGTINSKGYKVLDEHIGLIYGDSITLERADLILKRMYEMGFASSNIVFGVGSYTYQYMTRDTFAFAVKATLARIEGEDYMLSKDPVTDNGVKKSARGGVAAVRGKDGKLKLKDGMTFADFDDATAIGSLSMNLVFADSNAYGYTSLNDIRNTIDIQL